MELPRSGALRGIPDVTIATATPGRPPLLIDAKYRFIRTDRISRSDEIYKMLGYAENFRPGAGPPSRFRGVLIFPSNRSAHRIVDGPEGGQLDLITVDLSGNRDPADAALADALTHWATVA
jgi:5-methylcytosine-specific restriction endonuclease McrBC regulatory subunit McrC